LLAAAALVGAGLAYLQFTEQQRDTLKQFEDQQKASRALLISNQVAKGFELLGNKDKEIMQRLGGIYALEGVMNNSEDYHQLSSRSVERIRACGNPNGDGGGPADR